VGLANLPRIKAVLGRVRVGPSEVARWTLESGNEKKFLGLELFYFILVKRLHADLYARVAMFARPPQCTYT
jgi:hypothetical protein